MLNPPDQQQFPQVAINITRDGILISIMIAPTLSINQLIPEDQANAIFQKWIETRQQIKEEQKIIQLVRQTKNG